MRVGGFRVLIADLDNWMANYSSPWAVYHTLMACCLVALNERPSVPPVEIGETLRQSIAKIVMRAAWDQAKLA